MKCADNIIKNNENWILYYYFLWDKNHIKPQNKKNKNRTKV